MHIVQILIQIATQVQLHLEVGFSLIPQCKYVGIAWYLFSRVSMIGNFASF